MIFTNFFYPKRVCFHFEIIINKMTFTVKKLSVLTLVHASLVTKITENNRLHQDPFIQFVCLFIGSVLKQLFSSLFIRNRIFWI